MDKVDISYTPATAQEVTEARLITSVKKAKTILGIESVEFSMPEMLKQFQDSFISKSEKGETKKDLKQVIDSKNLLLRLKVESQIEQYGKFTLEVPYNTACIHCSGAGERYRFFYKDVEVECKYCDKGDLIIHCKACKGTGTYVNPKAPPNSKGVPCIRCNQPDSKTGEILVGKRKVKCRACLGTGRFKKFVIDSHIKTTTYCKHCQPPSSPRSGEREVKHHKYDRLYGGAPLQDVLYRTAQIRVAPVFGDRLLLHCHRR